MSYEEKLDIILKNIKEIYRLDEEFISIIKDNIDKRVKYYNDINPSFNNETIYINNSSTIGDFFLNRLLNNIRSYGYNFVISNPNQKDYDIEKQTLTLTTSTTKGDLTINKLKNRIDNLTDDQIKKTYNKIMFHQFGHALQANFNGLIGKNDEKYNLLIKKLVEEYPNIFIKPLSVDDLEIIQNGLIPVIKNDDYNNIRTYYSKLEDIELINEIFNEYEALIINNIDVQALYPIKNECYKYVYNFESTNYRITSFAFEMAILFGKKKTFEIMYKNSIDFYTFFDSFIHITTAILKENKKSTEPTVELIVKHLSNIKKENSLKSSFILDNFFLKCLEHKIKHLLENNNSTELKNSFKKDLEEFKKHSVKCDTANLEIDILYSKIESLLV